MSAVRDRGCINLSRHCAACLVTNRFFLLQVTPLLKKNSATWMAAATMERCKGCRNNFATNDASFFRLDCDHGFCRACLTQRCKASMMSKANSWITAIFRLHRSRVARCNCGRDIPLLIVTRILEGEELQEYERLWSGGRVACVSCSNSDSSVSIYVVPCGHTYCLTA